MPIDEFLKQIDIPYKTDESMSMHTTFRVGGPADYFVLPENADQLKQVVSLCKDYNVPYVVIGKGSNLLVNDEGIRGVVICTENMNNVFVNDGLIVAEAGAMLSAVSMKACEAGIRGLDFAYGIPGTVGGAVVMNAGAYGGEICDVLVGVNAVTKDGDILVFTADELELSYRHSCIEECGYVILHVMLAGPDGDPKEIKELMDQHMASRKEKQPLEYPSAGSTFKRPEGYFAGKLIQDAGLKGYTVGGAQVSEKHSGFVINKGGATAADILSLIEHVKEKVLKESGVTLECEVKLL